MNHSGQFAQGIPAAPMHPGREASAQHLNAAGYGYDQYQAMSSTANNMSVSSTPNSTPHSHNYNSEGDVPMEDATTVVEPDRYEGGIPVFQPVRFNWMHRFQPTSCYCDCILISALAQFID